MYQTSETKRWNVTVRQVNFQSQNVLEFKGVSILAIGSNFIALEDNGKEFIYTGGQTNIFAVEV